MNDILIGKGNDPVLLRGEYGNRHGLIAGATGTGKTVTLLVLAEGFSRLGVPVVIADVKGDVAGLAMPGTPSDRLTQRAAQVGVDDYRNEATPVVFWDLWGELGHPVRTTITEMGPTLLARLLELNETQEGVLDIAFRVADESGMLLLDLKDLRSLLTHVAEHRQQVSTQYGLVNTQSIGAIQRALLRLDSNGGERFFGEPALELADLMRQDLSGRGIVSILAAEKLVLKPRLYSSFLLWLMSELFETLPEVGDQPLPKLVFVFDEAHLLFSDCPPALRQRVEQVVRLIRSKGVGIYFCSQNPDDVPNEILGQLGNRVQHALRAFTPRDQKAVRTAAETFPPNPKVDVVKMITTMAVGEALVSMLGERSVPQPVQHALIRPPRCRMGAITPDERAQVRARSPVGGRYDAAVDRESAYEILTTRAQQAALAAASAAEAGTAAQRAASQPRASNRQTTGEAMLKSTVRTIGSTIGREIARGLLGSLLGRRSR
ncbi:MAG: helicase HerA-like domain-containing protein [Gemmatimonadota bacterium]